MIRWQIKFVWQLTAIVALTVLAALFAGPAAAQHAETGAEDFSRPEKQELQSLNCGQTITADAVVAGWWASGCDSEVDGRGYARYYTFTLAQQSDVAIALESGDADAYLYLRDGAARSGAARHEVDDSAGAGTNSRIAANALPAGTYTIEATTYASGETGDFTLTVTGISGVTTPAPTPGPDLIVQSASVSDSAPDAGAPFTLSATVFNQGGAASAATTLRYYRSTDATITSCDTQVGTDPVTGLSGTSPALTAAGPITADVVVAGQWASGCDSEVGGRGYARYYAFTLAQQSDVTIALESDDADAYLYLRDGAARSGAARHEDHDGGAGTNSRIVANALPAGTYTIEATTYASGATGDFTLTVTGLSGVTTPTSGADCGQTITADGVVAGRWPSGCDSEVDGRGYARYYTLTLGQQSDVAIALESDDADAYLYLRDGAARSGAARHEVDDSAGAGTNSRIAANALPAGTYTVEATTYSGGETGDFTLTLTGLSGVTTPTSGADCGQTITADGAVAGQWASGCDSEVDGRGYARYYAFTLAQQSDVAIALESGDADAYLYLRDGAARSGAARHEDHDGGAGTNSRIAANALPAGTYTIEATTYASGATGDFTLTLTLTGLSGVTTPPPSYSAESISLTAPSSAGTYYYGACVAAVAGESDTGNNCSVAVTVAVILEEDDEVAVDRTTPPRALRPDLVVQSASVSNSSPDAGATFMLSATVRNRGTAESDATTLRYYRSADSTITSGDTPAGTSSVDALAASATSDLSVTPTAPSSAGTYYYGACVASVSGESNTGNNCSGAVTVTVTGPDLVVQSSVTDSRPNAGATFVLSAIVRNQGGARSDATNLSYYLSTDATITSGDTEVGAAAVVGALAALATSDLPVTLTAPLSPGTYYYGACVAVVADESDPDNNCSGAVTVTVPSTVATDRAALVALYTATGGASWTDKTNWLSATEAIGEWHGVTTGSNGRVTGLDLSGNRLSGTIPPELGNLARLTGLYLNRNQLSGAIPPELGSLASLTGLYLYENQLTGAIPPELGSLASLTGLSLYENQLSGAIPPELGNLASLIGLSLRDNDLSGAIPPELGDLDNLTTIYLSGNPLLTGCVPVGLQDGTNNDFDQLTLPSCVAAPDLVVQSPSVSDNSPDAGATFTLSVTVLNQGAAASTVTTPLRYYRSADATITSGDTEVGTAASVGVLAASATSDLSVTLTAPSSAGTYYYGACVVTFADESNTDNNCSGAVTVTVINMDRAALAALYTATDGANWTTNTNWLSATEAMGQWHGVTTNANGRVTRLSLATNQLTGPIPSELGSLTSLTALHLNYNRLTGVIPSELGSLTSLTELYLDNNQLTEAIPSELGNLVNLGVLYLSGNQLTGCVPDGLMGVATNDLAALALPFCGPAMDRAALAALYTATDGANWTTNTNWLSDTEAMDQWHGVTTNANGRVTRLSLATNQLTGPIPSQLGSLTSLTALHLNYNRLTGVIPSELGSLTSLTELYLDNNQLTEAIPSELGNLVNLGVLYLSNNQLTGCVPDALRDVPTNDFATLGLSFCGPAMDRAALVALYTATSGASWTTDTNWLSSTPIGQWHGVTTGSTGRVTSLVLYTNQLSGPIPPELGNLTSLTGLSLLGNQLSGAIPSELGSLTSLTRLHLEENELSGAIPSELGSLTSLTQLSLNDNQLTGAIPSELGSLTSLTQLHLNDNRLTGAIPSELGSLTNLTDLFLSGNQLTGCVPENLKNVEQNDFGIGMGLSICGGPDLVIQSGTVNNAPDAILSFGESFTLSVTVRNQGDAASTATTLSYYRSADATITSGDTEVGAAASVSVLAGAATSRLSVLLTASSVANIRFYGACVTTFIGESDPDNNCTRGNGVRVTTRN